MTDGTNPLQPLYGEPQAKTEDGQPFLAHDAGTAERDAQHAAYVRAAGRISADVRDVPGDPYLLLSQRDRGGNQQLILGLGTHDCALWGQAEDLVTVLESALRLLTASSPPHSGTRAGSI